MALPRSFLAILAALLVVMLAGCGRSTAVPVPSPADFTEMTNQMTRLGVTVLDIVSGDAGCADRTLGPTAIAFTASGLDQVQPVRIRVYVFADRATWQRLAGSVASCARSYVTDPATYESLAPSPFVVSGQGPWAPGFAAALKTAFTGAAGNGG